LPGDELPANRPFTLALVGAVYNVYPDGTTIEVEDEVVGRSDERKYVSER
jgi:hypothetical protein